MFNTKYKIECWIFTFISIHDSLDWKEYGVEHEVKTVVNHKHLGDGSIILFHNDTKYTPKALPAILESLQAQGYKIVKLSELIIQDDYKIDHEGRQHRLENKKKENDNSDEDNSENNKEDEQCEDSRFENNNSNDN